MSTTNRVSLVTTKELLIATPLPKKTNSYSPVSHAKVINLTLESLDKAGINVINERYTWAREGRQAMGFLTLDGGLDKEMNIQLIWHNSYDKSMPLRAALGSNVIVCTNGMVRGDMGAFKRKHTGTIATEFKESLIKYIGDAGKTFAQLAKDKEALKNITLTKRTCAELIGRLHLEEDVLTATQVGIIKKEMENPSYDYKSDGTAWQLYNHCTVSLKEAHPTLHLSQHMDVHNFFHNEFKLELV